MTIGLDLDGTLLDSRLRHVATLRRVVESLALPLTEHDAHAYFRLKCDGATGIEALRRLDIPRAEEINGQWISLIESDEMLALDRLYPDTLTALRQRHARGDNFILVTGRQKPAMARRQIASLGLEEFLREIIVVDPRDRSQTKARATSSYALDAVVGDTEIDFQWAEELGVPFHASGFGFRSQAYWRGRQVTSHASLSAILDVIISDCSPQTL
jgi:phosphoglycolate phosphatase-like HAD superfamily hydrolase